MKDNNTNNNNLYTYVILRENKLYYNIVYR